MKKTISTLFFLCLMVSAFSQKGETGTVKQFYTEMGGPSVLFSANFDTRFTPGRQTGLGMRAGLGFTISDNDYDIDGNGNYTYYGTRTIANLPIGINYLFGKETSPHTFEVGAGTTFLFKETSLLNYNSNEKNGRLMGFANFMYRRQPVGGGFAWRIGFSPLINTAGDIVPFAAAGLGYGFK